ncbi:hypothetical protein EDB89DRAFT_1912787 [Lactarius sanguifluus]|nr:hypothetical protein EDB89DRAFT_1912787 [Lactarius sanguifluus]
MAAATATVTIPPTGHLTRGSSFVELEAKPLALHQDVLSSLMGLPDGMATSIKAAQLAHIVTKAEFEGHDGDEFGSAGAVVQGTGTASCQPKRSDWLHAKVDEIQTLVPLRPTNASTSQLKTSDATIESQQERLLELEQPNREINRLLYPVLTVPKVGRASGAPTSSSLTSQAQTNEPELKEFRRVSECSKVLESEHAALQRRYKDDRATRAARAAAAARGRMRMTGERVRGGARGRGGPRDAAREKDTKGHAKDSESKLRDQVAAFKVRVAQLRACGAV